MVDAKHLSPIDLRLKAISIALEPALMLGRIVALPLDDLQRLVSTGYYREARRRRMSHQAMARRFGKSLRTIATLAKEARGEAAILESSGGVEQQRRVIEVLSQEGAATREALAAQIPRSSIPLDETLTQLEEAGLVELDGDDVRPGTDHAMMLGEDADKRLDSLRHFLGTVTQVVYSRFFTKQAGGDDAFARVLTFAAGADALESFRNATYGAIRERAIQVDAEAGEDAVHASVAYCVVRSPDDHHWRDRSTG